MSTIEWKKTSVLVPKYFPSFITDDYPLFVAFVAAYHEWLDQEGNANHGIANFDRLLDVDLTNDTLLERFSREFIARIPSTSLADRRLLLKHARRFYRAKGTEAAARFLFRVMYGQEIDFYYPRVAMFRTSDSKWQRDTTLLLEPIAGANLGSYVDQIVTGETSGAIASADNILTYINGTSHVLVSEMFYSSSRGDFANGEYISVDGETVGQIVEVRARPGHYISFDSHPSGHARLQDSYYYQDFSYVIRSQTPFDTFYPIIKELVHPAGTKVFGELDIEQSLIPDFSIDQARIDMEFDVDIDMSTHIRCIPCDTRHVIDYEIHVSTLSMRDAPARQSGYVGLANTSNIGVLDPIAAWSMSDVIERKGLLGTAVAGLTANDEIIILDGANEPFRTVVSHADTATSARVANSFPRQSLANGVIFREGPYVLRTAAKPLKALAGVFRIANTAAAISYLDYPIASFMSWTVDMFTNGQGIIGTSTSWNTELTPEDWILTNSSNANSYNEVRSVDSSNTCTMMFRVIS